MTTELGTCVRCKEAGPVGEACSGASCSGLHYIPQEHHHPQKPNTRSLAGQYIGDFLVVAPLGQGGFGSVYLALKRPNFHTKGALKLFDPVVDSDDEINTVLKRYFMREIKTLSTLNEPNIVQLIDEGVHEHSPYLVMRYVENGTLLRQFMTLGRPADPTFIKSVVAQILRALKAAHGSGIVHRDLKPENVMLQGEHDHVYVLDFGLAKRVDEQFMTTATFGTPYYMAPEQLFPSRKELFVPYWEADADSAVLDHYVGQVGPACDLYALGVMVGELMTGRPIFQSHSTAELSVEKDRCRKDPVANLVTLGLPAPVMSFLRQCLAYLPTERYTTCGEFLKAFEGAMVSYEAFLQQHPEVLTSETYLPPKDRTSVAFHSTQAFDDLPELGMADTQALTDAPAALELEDATKIPVHAARAPAQPPVQTQRPISNGPISTPTVGPPKKKPEHAPARSENALAVSEVEKSSEEPIYQYMSPVIIYGMGVLVIGLLGLVAYLLFSDDGVTTQPKEPVVITAYDKALQEVREQVKTLPPMLARGEFEQAIKAIETIDQSEARLTPKEYQSVVAMLKIAKQEVSEQKKLTKAKSFFEKERYLLSLGMLSKIKKPSRVRQLPMFSHIEMASEDAIMRKAYNDVLLLDNKDAAREKLQFLLLYDAKLKDARALLMRLNAMPMDAPMAMPEHPKKSAARQDNVADKSPPKE